MILFGLLSMIADLLPSITNNPGESGTDTRLEQPAPDTGVRDDETS
jgi:hypothetical protein